MTLFDGIFWVFFGVSPYSHEAACAPSVLPTFSTREGTFSTGTDSPRALLPGVPGQSTQFSPPNETDFSSTVNAAAGLVLVCVCASGFEFRFCVCRFLCACVCVSE